MSLKETIIGNERAVKILDKSYKKGKLAHAYLFEGQDCLGKKKLALGFAGLIFGKDEKDGKSIENNPDLTILRPDEESEEIIIEQIRDLEKKLSLYPYYSKYKIVIIEQADRMNKMAANALLKTLEEPSATAIIILLTSNSGNIPETIKSRCQIIKFFPVSEKLLKKTLVGKMSDCSEIEKIIEISAGKPEKAIELAGDRKKVEELENDINKFDAIVNGYENEKINFAAVISDREFNEIINTLDLWTVCLRKSVINHYKNNDDSDGSVRSNNLVEIRSRINLISKTKKDLLTKNVNCKLAIENLFLGM